MPNKTDDSEVEDLTNKILNIQDRDGWGTYADYQIESARFLARGLIESGYRKSALVPLDRIQTFKACQVGHRKYLKADMRGEMELCGSISDEICGHFGTAKVLSLQRIKDIQNEIIADKLGYYKDEEGVFDAIAEVLHAAQTGETE